MKNKRRLISGGILGLVGHLLSQLSWWNDQYVKIPVAYVGGWRASLVYKGAFMPAFVVTYWLTNILGFVLMHKGICQIGG